jgi:broad specificity phosphatase PhoE
LFFFVPPRSTPLSFAIDPDQAGSSLTATFLLIRHAAHVDLDRRLSGRTPGVPLSAAGEAQAQALARRLAGTVDRVEASPLDRAQATAAAIGLPVHTVEALTEIDFGPWSGRSFADLAGDPEWDAWNAHRGSARPPEGESMGEAQARVMAHLRATAAAHGDRAIAAVTHADLVKAAVAAVMGVPLDNLGTFDIAPASVTRIVLGPWGGRVLALNEGVG